MLGIETSCDETAAAVLSPEGEVLAEAVLSQREHAAFARVVPEIAARAHLRTCPPWSSRSCGRPASPTASSAVWRPPRAGPDRRPCRRGGSRQGHRDLGSRAVRSGQPPGGARADRSFAGTGAGGAAFPYLLLLVSGGHCQCVAVRGVGRYQRLGGTIDDAAGEAFDKVAKLLGLGWPGGPALERLAVSGNSGHFALPRPLLGREGCDFSFSGLKTAAAQLVAAYPEGPLPARDAADIAAGFQAAVADVLADRVANALRMMPEARLLVVAGGVAANTLIRTRLAVLAQAAGIALAAPPPRLCGDNAVMVAWAGIERLRLGLISDWDAPPRPRWPLDEMTGLPA